MYPAGCSYIRNKKWPQRRPVGIGVCLHKTSLTTTAVAAAIFLFGALPTKNGDGLHVVLSRSSVLVQDWNNREYIRADLQSGMLMPAVSMSTV